MSNYFTVLNEVNVNDKKEKKNGLDYLSWAFAWGEVKKRFPEANYTIYENDKGWNYHTDGKTCWVKTGVTVEGIEHIETLAVMNYSNKSIPFDAITSVDVTKSIQRCLTKACARHGLGLYIYAGEDLPEASDDATPVNLKTVERPASLSVAINACKSADELGALYKQFKAEICDNKDLLDLMTAKGASFRDGAA